MLLFATSLFPHNWDGVGWDMWTFLAHPLDSTQHARFWYVLKVHSGKIESGGKKGSVNIKHAGSSEQKLARFALWSSGIYSI